MKKFTVFASASVAALASGGVAQAQTAAPTIAAALPMDVVCMPPTPYTFTRCTTPVIGTAVGTVRPGSYVGTSEPNGFRQQLIVDVAYDAQLQVDGVRLQPNNAAASIFVDIDDDVLPTIAASGQYSANVDQTIQPFTNIVTANPGFTYDHQAFNVSAINVDIQKGYFETDDSGEAEGNFSLKAVDPTAVVNNAVDVKGTFQSIPDENGGSIVFGTLTGKARAEAGTFTTNLSDDALPLEFRSPFQLALDVTPTVTTVLGAEGLVAPVVDAGEVYTDYVSALEAEVDFLDVYEGLNMNGSRITNLGAGVDDTDAVTVAQLKSIVNTGANNTQVVIGQSTVVQGKAVAIGYLNTASGDGAVAIGDPNTAIGTGAVAMGADNTATGNGALAIGNLNSAEGTSSIALGEGARSSGGAAIAIGGLSQAFGDNSVASGYLANATGVATTASGAGARATATEATALGFLSQATAGQSTALGNAARATDEDAVAIGDKARASGFHSTAVGGESVASGRGAQAFGWQSAATGNLSLAAGHQAKAGGINATAVGKNANAAFDASTALGFASTTTRANQVVLGGAGSSVTVGDIAASTAAQVGATDIMTVDATGTVGRDTTVRPAIASLRAAALVQDGRLATVEAASTAHATRLSAVETLNTAQSGQISALQAGQSALTDIVNRDRKDSRQGVAAAVAMAAAPMPSEAGRTSYTTNVSTFRGQQGFGAAFAHRFSSANPVALTFGVSHAGGKNTAARVGLAGEF